MKAITQEPATSGQIRQIGRFGSDAIEKLLEEIKLNKFGAQCIIERGDAFAEAISKATIATLYNMHVDERLKDEKVESTCGCGSSTSQKLAREIMGENYFGVEEAIKHFGVNPSKQQLTYLIEVPFMEEVLKSCKDTHILVAVFPLSILDVRTIAKKFVNQTLFYNQDWYDKQAFTKDKGEVGWQLVRKEPIVNSTNKNWNEQQALISKDEETPKAQIVVYMMISHFLATGERLFEKVYVRCFDLDSDGYRVSVGHFDDEGLGVDSCWDDGRDGSIGVSSTRK